MVVIAAIGLGMVPGCGACRATGEAGPRGAGMIGSWHATSGVRSLVISIREDGRALVLLMQPGQHTIKHVPWEPFHGGILIQDITRMRLWPGRHADEIRGERETGSEEDGAFPARFFMGRVGEREIPAELRERPVPAHWKQMQVDEEASR